MKDAHEQIDFQTDYVMDLAKEANYGHNLDVAQIFYDWHHDKVSSQWARIFKEVHSKKTREIK